MVVALNKNCIIS